MIKAKHNIIIYPFFKFLTWFLLKRNFNTIKLEGDFEDNGNPILIIANHISWWDGFWISHLNLKEFHRKFHFMMLEDQLKKHWYLQYVGGYSVKKKTRSVIESLHYTLELLGDERNMVVMFPQGEISSIYNNSISFEKGVQRITETTSHDLQILFLANFIDYFSNTKPNLFMRIKTFSIEALKESSIECEYNNFYKQALIKQKNKVS